MIFENLAVIYKMLTVEQSGCNSVDWILIQHKPICGDAIGLRLSSDQLGLLFFCFNYRSSREPAEIWQG